MQPDFDTLVTSAREAVPAGLIAMYLFGSRAAGRAHRESDTDVGVLLDPHVLRTSRDRFDVRLTLISRLSPAAGGSGTVDVVVLNDAPPHLVRHIMTEGRRLFCGDPEQDHAARRTSLSRAADLEPFLRRTRTLKLDALAR